MLRSDLCEYSDVYIVMKEAIIVTDSINAKRNKAVVFKNNAPVNNCISKINGVKIDNAEGVDVVMPMYNTVKIAKTIEKLQEVCGIIIEMNKVILFLLILNLLNTRQVLQEILTILLVVINEEK